VVAEVVLTEEEVEVRLPWMVVVVVAGELDGNVDRGAGWALLGAPVGPFS
jgi:hypothetical protein